MEPFLKQIAEKYAANEADEMIDYCFVFPNKRSGIFFANYLRELGGSTISWQPQLTTISQLVMDLTDGVEATRIELLFILYNAYFDLLDEQGRGSDIVDFDKFQYWGDVILNDFNDVDRYLVDPSQLFSNLSALKEIQTNFLTPEQIQVIREFWGEEVQSSDVADFWKHLSKGEKKDVTERFLRLWNLLEDLYNRFRERLEHFQLSYSGMAYRSAVGRLKDMSAEALPYRRYIFIGFNVLSTSEVKIFELLQKMGVADFYWDNQSPAFDNQANRATRFVGKYVDKFKSLYDLDTPKIEHFGEILIEGVPSNVGQAKIVGEILNDIYTNNPPQSAAEAINTAVVLPDEQLLIPVLHSLPEKIKDVNVTMGYPLRHTPISALMASIVVMQTKAQDLRGARTYYFDHVFTVLSHPLLRAIAPETCAAIVEDINKNHIYNLKAADAVTKWPELAPVFTPVTDPTNPDQVYDYAEHLSTWLLGKMKDLKLNPVEIGFVQRYREGVAQLRHLSARYSIRMSDKTFFHLMDRLLSTESINFVGEPLKGLQVMGVLETRALDFETLILPSMNERIFPRKHFAPTFIPNNLRRGYGMATIEFQESIYAYYFYRLLTRAKRVCMLYDTRTGGLKSGEMSRYIYQLLKLYPNENITVRKRSFNLHTEEPREIVIAKSKADMEKLLSYTDPQSGRYLSPSAIDTYIKCPLKFYLSYVKGYFGSDDLQDFMDEGTYGTIFHTVVQKLYEAQIKTPGQGAYITESVLDTMIANHEAINNEVNRTVNEIFLKRGENCYEPLEGENKILGQIIERFVKLMFEKEKGLAPYTFICGEKSYQCQLPLNNGKSFNLKGTIDRVDKLNDGRIRLIDYKTGSDKTAVSGWENVFDTENTSHQKCFLQLFLYANAYMGEKKYNGSIQPMVYKIRSLSTEGLTPMTFNKVPIEDIQTLNKEFLDRLSQRMEELFDVNEPFRSTPVKNSCKYCHFCTICDREEE